MNHRPEGGIGAERIAPGGPHHCQTSWGRAQAAHCAKAWMNHMSEDTMTDEDKATLRNALDVLKRMEREGTLEPTKAPLKHLHSARVVCGACGVGNNITLGLASAIACGDCGTEIALGDGTADELLKDFEAYAEAVGPADLQSCVGIEVQFHQRRQAILAKHGLLEGAEGWTRQRVGE